MSDSPDLKTSRRSFRILELLAERGPTDFGRIDELFDFPRTTIHEHLSTLESLGYILNQDGTYQVGSNILALGVMAREHRALTSFGESYLYPLAEETGEFGELFVHDGGIEGSILRLVKSPDATDMGLYEGMAVPLVTTTPGRAILSEYPDSLVETICEKSNEDFEELRERLGTIRTQGYDAVKNGYMSEVASISAPVVCDEEVIGAVTIGAPSQTMRKDRYEKILPDLVTETANKIAVEITHARVQTRNTKV